MFPRNILQELREWSRRSNRKPLILRGARQVGKTTAVRQFSADFSHFIYLNLELPADRKPFESFSDFDSLLQSIFFLKNKTLSARSSTLVFIDEIQEVPQAIQQLRYFFENAPDIPVIAAGSMLESLFDPQISFPVGRVDYMVIHPVSFPEFLYALGEHAALEQLKTIPLNSFAHDKLLALFRTYCLIGGMPEIVAHYAEHKDLTALGPIYESLLVSYIDDVEKYAVSRSQVEHIRLAIRASFAEAGKRIKFQNFGNSNYKSREMGEALRALEKALLIHLIYPQTHAILPLLPDKGKSPRLQVLDTGMMNYFAGIQRDILGTDDIHEVYQGKVIEHVVGQELLARQYSALHGLIFWVREKNTSSAEVDYLHVYKEKLVPIEVRAGSSGKLKSLAAYMDMTNHDLAIRLYTGELAINPFPTKTGKAVKLLNLPCYLVSEIDNYLEWLTFISLK